MDTCTRSLCLLGILAGSALAQSQGDQPQPALLAGPSVAETNITALNSSFVVTENQRQRLAGGLDARLLRLFIAELRDSDDSELQLTPEQEQEIASVARDYQAKVNAFERTHARELRRLRARGQQPERSGTPTPAPESMNDEPTMMPKPMMTPDTSARIAELEALRPDSAELQKRFRAVLSERQREALDERIEAAIRERIEQRQMEQIRKEVADQMARRAPAQVNLDRLPPRVRQRIEALPPEERAAALERLRQQYTDRGGLRRNAGEETPNIKTAPSMDEVEVPRPGGG